MKTTILIRVSFRRAFAVTTFGLVLFTIVLLAEAAEPSPPSSDEGFTFFFSADPQINIPKCGTAGTERMIDVMNKTPVHA